MTLKHENFYRFHFYTAMKYPSFLPIILIACVYVYLHNLTNTVTFHRPSWDISSRNDNMNSRSRSHGVSHTFSPWNSRDECLSWVFFACKSFRLILLCKMGAFSDLSSICHEIRCNFKLDVIWKYFLLNVFQLFFSPFRLSTFIPHCFRSY